MSLFDASIFGRRHAPPDSRGRTEVVQLQNALRRVLAFTGHTIDDVINDPIARTKVRGFYKLHRWIDRKSEVGDLERQWNRLRT
jgi:hypothetical protein